MRRNPVRRNPVGSTFVGALVAVALVAAACVPGGGAKPSPPGAAVLVCVRGGWADVVAEDGSPFTSLRACVRYVRAGGTPRAPEPPAPDPDAGLVPAAEWRARQDAYLAFATARFDPGNVVSTIAHHARAGRDADFDFDPAVVAPADWDPVFTKVRALVDTSDFDVNRLTWVWHRMADDLSPPLRAEVEDLLLGYKYWYTEPTPDEAGIDDQYYWTENHQLMFHVAEYLAGQAFPGREFATTGETGAERQARAADRLRAWFAERAEFGFAEWYSNVYANVTLAPLVNLAEHAADDDLATLAAMAIDLVLFEQAVHLQRGALGATQGRAEKKNKMPAYANGVYDTNQLLFDASPYGFRSTGNTAAVMLAAAERYRPAEVVRRVAADPAPAVDRSRMGIPLDAGEPLTADPVHPYGFAYDGPGAVERWWGMGALTAWQVVPLTIETIDEYDLWETTNFAPFLPLRPIAEGDPAVAVQIAAALHHQLALALLAEVDTYSYRTPDYQMSTAQDYRPGSRGEQYHAWQATFDPFAIAFTTHPSAPPAETTDWDVPSGYWEGTASMPRSAQHENVALHLYAPQYPQASPPPLDALGYLPETHAYLPQDHFDEVVRAGHWTFARHGDGYLGLWSWREPDWRAWDPAVVATDGMVEPFDLVAEGGADNVWIAELGRAEDDGSFADFRARLEAAPIDVAVRPASGGVPGGFDVTYGSPSQGVMTFGWTGPLTVEGETIAISGYDRFDNPWAQVPFRSRQYAFEAGGWTLDLDFDAVTRTSTGPG